jgi:hypothetical protein
MNPIQTTQTNMKIQMAVNTFRWTANEKQYTDIRTQTYIFSITSLPALGPQYSRTLGRSCISVP